MPQDGAYNVAFPLMLTPSIVELGGPSVYKQPVIDPLVPPLVFVATARAVIVLRVTPKIFMK
jgi:hypothetical protein